MQFIALAWALAATLFAGQAPRPVTLVSEVRAAIAAHDLAGAEALIVQRRAQQGNTSEVIEAVSWLGRGALAERQLDRAERFAAQAQTLTLAALGSQSIDEDAKLASALGAAIEVQAQVAAARGARSDAIVFLERELKTYRRTGIAKRIQKNINLLTLEGHPAPALDLSESLGAPLDRATARALGGQVVVLFFWAHWCPDCKAEGPILAKLFAKYQSNGLAIVAPTQRFGYVAGGRTAPPAEELLYIREIRDRYYPILADVPVPVSVVNHERYGVSSTPTLVILDRQGIVRLYHPGRMTEEELESRLRPLLVPAAAPVR
jgi:cytochrome c biogenesis protein CcmG/thiol:disulfide interchange protein DsbE